MFSYGLIFFFVYSLVLSRIPVYAEGDKYTSFICCFGWLLKCCYPDIFLKMNTFSSR